MSSRNFFVQRFSRLYPLHLVTLLLVAFLQYIYSNLAGHPFVYSNNDAHHFFLNLLLASGWGLQNGYSFNAPAWSISVEVLVYAFFFIAARKSRSGITMPLLLAGVFFAVYGFTDSRVCWGSTMFFLGGGVFYTTLWISRKRESYTSMVFTATLLGWLLVFVNFHLYELAAHLPALGKLGYLVRKGYPGFFLFPLTISSVALLEIQKKASYKSIAWIGDITYSSYLIHFPLQIVAGILLIQMSLGSSFYLRSEFLVGFMVVLFALSLATYRYFEMPAQRWVRQKFMIR